MATAVSKKKENLAADPARVDNTKGNTQNHTLPTDMLSDLKDAFAMYDKDNCGYINQVHLKNILHNFGFHRLSFKEQSAELDKADSKWTERTGYPFEFVKHVIAKRWATNGMWEEAKDCFNLFDNKERGYIVPADLKRVLSDCLEFPITEQDVADIMQHCDTQGVGQIKLKEFAGLYLQ